MLKRSATLVPTIFTLFIVGFFIMAVGITILIAAAVLYGRNTTSSDAIIVVGPIPIVLGAGSEAPWMVLFAAILTVLSVIIFLIMRKQMKQSSMRPLFSRLFPLFHKARTEISEPTQ
jgi:uncharacterized membrane protein